MSSTPNDLLQAIPVDDPVAAAMATYSPGSLTWRGSQRVAALMEGGDATQTTWDQSSGPLAKVFLRLIQALKYLGAIVSGLNDTELAGNGKLDALTTALGTANDYSRQMLALQQGQIQGTDWVADWSVLAEAGTAKTVVQSPTAGLSSFGLQVQSATLLGSTLGGGAKLVLYYADTATALPTTTAANPVVIRTVLISNNTQPTLINVKKAVPAGKFVRAFSSNGGVTAEVFYL